MLVSSVLLLGLAAGNDCDSVRSCNRLGTEAYQAGDYLLAAEHFDRQIDYAETALQNSADEARKERLQAARDLALNNAALAYLKAGECLKARAYLDLARAEARATLANRRQLTARCGEAPAESATPGIYWQYAGHGLWNRVQISPTGDETLRLDAFWMRTGRGPMDEYGIKAFGELQQVALHIDGTDARGQFDGLDESTSCRLVLRFIGQSILIEIGADPNCQIGGAGALLQGRYVLVSTVIIDAEG
jgi:hypothetical protein